jgi:serine/threonine protein kinase
MVAILKENMKWVTCDKTEVIGKGQFGIVYRGERKARQGTVRKWDAGPVAVKYPIEPVHSRDSIRAFLNEVEAMSRVRHPCCLSLFAWSFDARGTYVLVTELAHTSLSKVLEQEAVGLSPDSWSSTAKSCCAYGIASGMAYLHSKNVIHRDLKPANVLLDRLLRPRIADFGLAKLVSVENQMKMTMKVGTPLYMAPELMVEGSEDGYTGAVDVYAFGVLLFELVTASKPFAKKNFSTAVQVMNAVLKSDRPEIPPEVPDGWRDLVGACAQQAPNDRPPFETIISDLKDSFRLEDTDEAIFDDFVRDVLSAKLRDE